MFVTRIIIVVVTQAVIWIQLQSLQKRFFYEIQIIIIIIGLLTEV